MANYAYTDYYFVGQKKELEEFISIISIEDVRAELGVSEILNIEEDYSPEVYRVFVSTVTKWREYSEDFEKIIRENLLNIKMHWITEELACLYFAKSADGDFYFPFKYLLEADFVGEDDDIYKEYFENESGLVSYANEIFNTSFQTMEDVENYANEFNKTHKDSYITVLKAVEK